MKAIHSEFKSQAESQAESQVKPRANGLADPEAASASITTVSAAAFAVGARLAAACRAPIRTAALLLAALFVTSLPAALAQDGDAVDPAVEKRLRAVLGAPAVDLPVESISRSRMPGMYRVQLEQGPQLYVTEEGDFFILGDLFSVGAEGFVNIAEQQRSVARQAAVDAIPDDKKIIFPAKGETLAHLTVFTDVSCFYCQKLHKEVPELNRRGIEVRYLAYPRQGIGSPGFRQLASAWCADDRQGTLTRLKNREELPENVCPGNPVAEQFALGQELGVRGTPAIVMPSGEMIPGYKSADDLATLLGVN
ncbi:MAG: DsbC family protein [Halieaceae bacterium]|jgi:thiol:disulfide interchange protein DsbC|nr:DsbC family protein [Halieaceae bacterium]